MQEITLIQILQVLIPVLIALITSSGFWLFVSSSREKKSLYTELLIGLAHDRIVSLGLHYITRGYITQDEYENLNVYLFRPYEKLGGNGSVRRIMLEVDRLPIKRSKLDQKPTGETIP
jgi:hypothetical protein